MLIKARPEATLPFIGCILLLAHFRPPYFPVLQPLDHVVLRLKLLDFSDVMETLDQCIDPPEPNQVKT